MSPVLSDMALVTVGGESKPGSEEDKPKAALIASSTWAKTKTSTSPSLLMRRLRSTARIWLKPATEATAKPVEGSAGRRTWSGDSGSLTVEVIGATMVTAL